MESSIGDYRAVDGINVAHAGRTVVSLFRFAGSDDDGSDADPAGRGRRTCTCMEETWSIEEVDFNIMGLSAECFLPPRDMIPAADSKPVEKEQRKKAPGVKISKNGDGGLRPAVARKALVPAATGLGWFGPAKVVAVDETVDTAE
ncbi:unnamed protein product [Urochloa humidicola]